MRKSELQKFIRKGYSIRRIASEVEVSPTTIRYYLSKFGLSTTPLTKKEYFCSKCGEEDPTKFYGHKKSICGKCHNEYTLELGKKKKLYCVEKLGGKCKKCGYNKCIEALDLHHVVPGSKDPGFKSLRGWSYKRIDDELKKCILLCANCHREEHAKDRFRV